ncbi:PIN domain-containing protein [Aquabacterium sp. J223]|uniref:PIN domain-containing protein n=1 Tax=Aquabacterium sp. J223 TaxID=2898431 RepID=UPI0021AD97DD|nr:PIN domain-containing protein [Aquabacterium sp. J223]UUX96570.1 PIN domain-containing protein [Aquabacterium sp. J223]
MSAASVFVDANVLLYSEDGRDPVKQQAALKWLDTLWQRQCGRLSSQTLSEFYVNATRKIRPALPAGEARAKVRRFAAWQPWQIDAATLESAWAVESRFGLHFWDSLVIAAAQHMGCRYVLSEDMADGQDYGSVQVVSPFGHGPELLDQPEALR